MSAQFNIKAADPAAVSRIERGLGLPRFVAATLVARGIRTPHDAREFLNPSLERDWLDPYIIPGLSDVADALEEGRQFGRVAELRGRIGQESLEELFVDVLAYWTILIIEQGRPLHPDTVNVWNAYVMKNQKPYLHRKERQ
mgnify:CR=1 FL=1